MTARSRLRFRSDKAPRIKPQASSIQHSRLTRGPNAQATSGHAETVDMQTENSDPRKVARENKVKTGDRQTFDKGVERSKHRVFEHKQEEIWKEKKWNKGGKENTEVESAGIVTEKDKRNGQNKPRTLRFGEKFRSNEPTRHYYDDDEGKDQEGVELDEDSTRTSQYDQRYTPATWTPESSGWKKIHQS